MRVGRPSRGAGRNVVETRHHQDGPSRVGGAQLSLPEIVGRVIVPGAQKRRQLRRLRRCTTVILSQRDERSKELDLCSIDPHSDPTLVQSWV